MTAAKYVNIARRHLSKGQQAMVAAKAVQFLDSATVRGIGEQNNISKSRVSQVAVVLTHAPDLAKQVNHGALGVSLFLTARQSPAPAAEPRRETAVAAPVGNRSDARQLSNLDSSDRVAAPAIDPRRKP